MPPATKAARAEAGDGPALSHNLLGQRLGRKGRGTRDRIIAALGRLLADPDAAISLSAVAREASLGMTTLYLYFGDLTELLLAVLEPIAASAEESHVAHLRARWSDETLDEECFRFIQSVHAYWRNHARILHLRNFLGDAGDERLRAHRQSSAMPLIQLIAHQMDCEDMKGTSERVAMATVLFTGIERVATVNTDAAIVGRNLSAEHLHNTLQAQARLLSYGIRFERGQA